MPERDSNPLPSDLESDALPLSQRAVLYFSFWFFLLCLTFSDSDKGRAETSNIVSGYVCVCVSLRAQEVYSSLVRLCKICNRRRAQ
jgi:hypothetical protein